MRILRVYIENFGKLSKKEFNFQEGFNKVFEENGYGKTTLATFIKSMFYGLKSSTKKHLNENDKRKYEPWQGGNYGGFLEFSINEKDYRVERFFGKKDSEDTFSLINLKTGKSSIDYSENLGEEIFGLDEESYERCTFIPQKEIEGVISDKLSLKLINMIQGTSSKDSFEKAVKLIDEKSVELKKKKGNSGKIADKEFEIAEISERVNSLKQGLESLTDLQIKLKEVDDQIRSLESEKHGVANKIKIYLEQQTLIANKKYIDDKKKNKLILEENINNCKHILNGQEVGDEQLEEILRANQDLNNLKFKLSSVKEESLSDKKYIELNEIFKDNTIDEKQVDDIIKKDEKLKEINSKIRNGDSRKINNSHKKKPILLVVLLLLSMVGFALGLVFIESKILCSLFFALSGLVLICDILIYFKRYIDIKTALVNKGYVTENLLDLEQEKENLEIEIKSFLMLFKYKADNITASLYDLKSKVKEYNLLKTEINNKNIVIKKLSNEIQNLENKIYEFFIKFQLRDNLSFVDKVQVIKNAKNTLKSSINNLNNIQKELNEFENVEFRENIEEIDIKKLQKEENEIQGKIDLFKEKKTDLIRGIDKIKNNTIDVDELENVLEEKINERNELKKQHQILSLANKFLKEANDNLTAKYKKPMQDGLNKYLNLVLNENQKEFDINTELKVSFEEYGMKREIDYLSKGYKGVVNLCVRFALIDCLFKKEKPFVVLDDPFVNFDKEKIQNALNIIKELSKEYQIIYFTCHESRV